MDTPIFKKKFENKQATYNKTTEERRWNSKNSYFTKNARISYSSSACYEQSIAHEFEI